MRKSLKIWISALALTAAVSVPLISHASNLTSLRTFIDGGVIYSADVNANFAAVQTAVNSKQDALSGTSCASAGNGNELVSGVSANGTLACTTALPPGATIAANLAGPALLVNNAGGTAVTGNGASAAGATAFGVAGSISGNLGVGTLGVALPGSTTSYGIEGASDSSASTGVFATNEASVTGVALSIGTGLFQVQGAGTNTQTTAFTWIADASNITSYWTNINNPVINGNSGLIIMITQKGGGAFNPHPVGIDFQAATSQWIIFNEDQAAMPVGAEFNLLVISP